MNRTEIVEFINTVEKYSLEVILTKHLILDGLDTEEKLTTFLKSQDRISMTVRVRIQNSFRDIMINKHYDLKKIPLLKKAENAEVKDSFINSLETLSEINHKLDQLLQLNLKQNSGGSSLQNWISEKEAQSILGKKVTSLWKLRKEGQIISTKVGHKIFYSMKSIQELLEKGSS